MDKKQRVMSLDDILRGGDNNVMLAEVPGLYKQNEVAVVRHRPVSAGTMIEFQEQIIMAQKAEKDGENPRHVERMVKMLAAHLCDEKGNLIADEQKLREAPATSLVKILKAITSGADDDAGNPSSEPEATSSGSPTDLPVT